MSSRWVPVFQGEPSQVLVLQSSCEASGIPTFVPDLNLQYLDPSARGGNFFLMQLLVPEDRLEDARTLVPATRRSGIPEVNPDAEELALMARRVRICAVLIITAPLGVLFGLEYRKRMLAAAELPAGHDATMMAFWFSVAVSVLVPLYYLLRSLGFGS
jgi:hypothetical protein